MRRTHMRKMLEHLSVFAILLLAMMMFGCEGDKGERGLNGTSFGTLNGRVVDTAFPPHNLAGVTVTPSPAVQGVAAASTRDDGTYDLSLPNGNYTLTYSRAGYASKSQSATVVATQTTTLPIIALVQTSAAVINVANANFGNRTTATVSATTLVNDPALQGQTAVITFADMNGNVLSTGPSATLHRPSNTAYTASVADFAKVRKSVYPPGFDPLADANDFDVPKFETLDRLQVLPITPDAYRQASNTQFKVYSRVGNAAPFSTFSTVMTVGAPGQTMPFVPNPGIRNIPLGQPVVIQGKDLPPSSFSWSIISRPPTSNDQVAKLTDTNTRFPSFIPDAPGTYVITDGSSNNITLYAGPYTGALTVDPTGNNNPLGVVEPGCTASLGCHPAGNARFATPYKGGAQFFDTTAINTVFNIWTSSGHRHIMVKAMTLTPDHYTLNGCARCHSVGFSYFSSAIKSGGFSDVIRQSTPLQGPFTDAVWRANYPKFFKGYPDVLRLSEVQCESCHGPGGTDSAHQRDDPAAIDARMTVSSDMCGNCHGEPLRHGRYQEWRVSGHGDFQTAITEAPRTPDCVGCHTGQAFPLWIRQLQGTDGNPQSPLRTLNAANQAAVAPFMNADKVQPQTCQVCHLVHNPGSSSGLVGAMVILRGDYQPGGQFAGFTPLLPSGFQANGVGKGALCITCHNSRNGGVGAQPGGTATLHEDGDPNFGALAAYSAPHEACQSDVLMGRNAYYFSSTKAGEDRVFVQIAGQPFFNPVPQTGQRSAHSFIADTCVACHVQRTPTDPTLGYPPGVAGAGTNHTFNIVTDRTRPAADQVNALCSQCHGGFQGTGVQQSFDDAYRQLLISAGRAVLRVKFGSTAAIPAGTTIVYIPGRTPQVSVNGGVPVPIGSSFNNTTQVKTVGYLDGAVGTLNATVTAGNTGGFNRDLAKANWNISLVAPKYNATTITNTGYSNGTPVLTNPADPKSTVGVAGDQSKAVHNPSFVFNLMSVTQSRLDAM